MLSVCDDVRYIDCKRLYMHQKNDVGISSASCKRAGQARVVVMVVHLAIEAAGTPGHLLQSNHTHSPRAAEAMVLWPDEAATTRP